MQGRNYYCLIVSAKTLHSEDFALFRVLFKLKAHLKRLYVCSLIYY